MYTTSFLDIPPLRRIGGTLRLPGSKSISNRALLLAGFGTGTTTLEGLLVADDTEVMLAALTTLGCTVVEDGGDLRVGGLGGATNAAALTPPDAPIHLGNAGTAMRPLAAALALFGSGGADGHPPATRPSFELSGTPRMHERPIGDLVDALRALGASIEYLERDGFPPLRIRPATRLALAAPIRVRGDVSSQFLTALLLALPLRADRRDALIEVEGELISKPYVEITLRLLAAFGVAVERDGWRRFRLPGGARPHSPGRWRVEGDASSASYFIGAGAIGATDTALRIEGVGAGSMQGDLAFVEAVRAMGADVRLEADAVEVRRSAWPLRPIELDCNALPDAAMTLAVLALYAAGTSRLSNIASWRVKETDRLSAMASELRRLGATVDEGADRLSITPPVAWRAARIDTYDDHRMAMALSLAAFNGLAGAHPPLPVRIVDPRCVAKTYPTYFETLFDVARPVDGAVPVLAIDGPTASGKGTLAGAVARSLGYHLLDSGACYRAAALAALDAGIDADDEAGLVALTASLELRFDAGRTFLGERDVGESLRLEAVGAMASRISAWPGVRAALLGVQLGFRRLPGLVADGRDMGSVVFPDAGLKIFLVAGTAERAARRHRQLMAQGIHARLADLRAGLEARDARDTNRSASPLKPAEDAMLLDNSALTVEASTDEVLRAWEHRRPFAVERPLPAGAT